MLRSEIVAQLKASSLETENKLRDEFRRDVIVMQKDIESIKRHGVEVDGKLTALQVGQTGLSCRLEAVEANGTKILEEVKKLSDQTTTIVEETEDGRKITKHFRSWGTVSDDVKKFWPHALAGWLGFKALGGFLAEHGITWMSIWGGGKR